LKKLNEWREKRTIRQLLRINLTGTAYIDRLLKRMSSSFKTSLELYQNEIESAISGYKFLQNLLLTPLQEPELDEKKLEASIASILLPQLRIVESMKLLEDALLLALSGRYTSAYATMRTALECMTVGGFYHGLSSSALRSRAKEIRGYKGYGYPKTFMNILEELISKDSSLEDNGLNLEFAMENYLKDHDPPLAPPNFRRMLVQILDWYQIWGIEDPMKDLADELYEELSVYAHAMQDATTYMQAVSTDGDYTTLNSGTVNDVMLSKFLERYKRLLDRTGAMFFSVIHEHLGHREWKASILSLIRDFYSGGKPLETTYDAVFAAMNLSRTTDDVEVKIRDLLFKRQRLLDFESTEIRYINDLYRVTLSPSLGMISIEVKIWKAPIWDVFHLGFTITSKGKEKYEISGITRATRIQAEFPKEFFLDHLDRIAVRIVEELVESRGLEYKKTINTIINAYRTDKNLLYYGQQTWEVDWDRDKKT
jgi:hypothetical protein